MSVQSFTLLLFPPAAFSTLTDPGRADEPATLVPPLR
jgi:hypothetical protein